MRRGAGVLLLVGLCAGGAIGDARQVSVGPAAGQQAEPSRTQPPTFRAGINVVRVDVIVTDRSGRPVGDLKPEDFEVTEAGKRQTIDTFKLVALDGGLMATGDATPQAIRTDTDEEREAARDDVRLFAMFLDDYHVRRESSTAMRQQLARFVETQLGPSDMIGIMYPLEGVGGVRMSRNLDAIRRAVLQFEGRKYDYTPKFEAEQYAYRTSADQIERIRNQVSFSALKSLIAHMGSLKEGRKALILVSEGYAGSLPPQLQNLGGAGGGGITDPSAGNSPLDTSRQAFAAMDVGTDIQAIYELANRNNVSIYTVDPRGLAGAEFGADLPNVNSRTDTQYQRETMDTLRVLAENTDGRAVVNRNDLTLAMKQIVVDSSAYYLLGYNSTPALSDGKFHEISVKVKRPGLQVRHRKGYWALKPEEAARLEAPRPAPAASPVEAALASTTVPRNRVVRTWFGSERGDSGATRVTFVWEQAPPVAGAVVRDTDRPARVTLTVSSTDGSPVFRGRVPDGAQAAAPARVTFDAPPGRMQLRLSVENATGSALDTETREITVPDLTAGGVVLGTPVVYRARTLPEMQRLRGDAQAVPAVAREFSRTDRLLVRVPAYGPRADAPAIAARLLNRAGQLIADLPVAPADAARPAQMEVTLSSLPPGEYGIAISPAAASPGSSDAAEIVAFRLVP